MPAILKLKLDRLLFPSIINETYKFEALSKEQSTWRANQNSKDLKYRDLFTALLEARDPDTGLGYSQEELIAEAGLLIIAGSDTMATAITSTIFYLLHYPSTLARLQTEVRNKFSHVENIRSSSEFNSCTYLIACIDEAMRLSPGVGGILPRETLPGGIVVDDHFFLEGIDLGVPHYGIHHNSEYFPQPFSFVPERRLIEGGFTNEDVAKAKSAFCPFSVGRTSCIGKRLAYNEMGITLAHIVWLFDMRLKPASSLGEGRPELGDGRMRREEFQLWYNFTSSHEGPLVEFRPVER